MSDSIYQDAIMALAKTVSDNDNIADATARCRHHNPLCGDEIALAVIADTQHIRQLSHSTRGCVLCKAAAAKMSQLALQHPQQEVLTKICQDVTNMFNSKKIMTYMEIFTPVINHPARYGCVLLPFQALADILRQCKK